MNRNRVTGPGQRTITLARAATLVAGLMLAACATPVGTSTSDAAPATGSPGAARPDPTPTRWPGTTVLAVMALGAADGEIDKARADLQNAADAQDLPAMRGAADGLAKMIDGLMPNIDRLDAYEGTKPVAAVYRAAFPEIAAGAKQLRDAVAAKDGPGITAGYVRLVEGIKLYGPIRKQIGGLVEQAIVQQRIYVK